MPQPRQHWFALVFVLLAVACLAAIVLLVSGRWRIAGEGLGLAVGAVLVLLIWLGVAIR